MVKLLKQKIDLLQFSSKLELRGLFFISLPTAVAPTRKQNLNYKLFALTSKWLNIVLSAYSRIGFAIVDGTRKDSHQRSSLLETE